MRGFVIGLVLLFVVFTFVGAIDQPDNVMNAQKAAVSR